MNLMMMFLYLLAFNVIIVIQAEDICSLKPDTGPCRAAFKRWYYNSADKECQQFLYGGCRGNANNFKTKEECENKCADIDVCSRPAKSGPCKAHKPRWYYNSADKECQEFIWGGCQSNGNNFMTKAECQNKCAEVCRRPAWTGPCKALFRKWYYNYKNKKCEMFVYGGCQSNGNNFDTKEECEDECTDIDECSLPIVSGPCEAYMPRWAFNTGTQKCERFIYGGCGGNANNFDTEEKCFNACDNSGCNYVDCTSTHCPAGIKTVKGCRSKKCQCKCPCKKKKCTNPNHECVLREDHTCKGKSCPLVAQCDYKLCSIGELFSSSGCGYDKMECPAGFTCKWSPVDAPHGCCPNDVCHANPDSGCGKKKKMRWYYDYKKQECFKFRSGGKGGNGNNFKTKAACLKKCS